jgi:hypothetical protein
MPKSDDEDDLNVDMNENTLDDEPIPARRDVRIFHRKKEDGDSDKNDFDEDVFV